MKRTSMVPIAIGFAWGLAIQASLAAGERERERKEELHALERELLAAAIVRVRARARDTRPPATACHADVDGVED